MSLSKGYNFTRVKVQQTLPELLEDGQAQLKLVPYAELAQFTPKKRPIAPLIQTTHALLRPELIPIRNQRMQANPFAFFRGSVELMSYDLVRGYNTGIPAIICGDAHVGNFGFFASPERQLLFDLNDFDEAGINYWEWDLKRLLVSVLLAGQQNGFDAAKLKKLLPKVAKAYRKGMQAAYTLPALQRYYPKNTVTNLLALVKDDDEALLQRIIAKAQKRTSTQVVAKYTQINAQGVRRFIDQPPRSTHPTKAVTKSFAKAFAQYRQTVRPEVALLLSAYHVTDVIHHSVGVGSFGTLCYLVLLTNIDGSHLVLQVKEALPTRKRRREDPKALTLQLEATEGERIIGCQKVLQSASDPFLGYFQLKTKHFYVRQFRDMKESIDLTKLTWPQFKSYVKVCSVILANAHSQSPRGGAILGYLSGKKAFDEAISHWAQSYEKQVNGDYQAFLEVLASQPQSPATATKK